MALARELYFKANRDLIAKALAELYYEEVLPAQKQGEHFELALASGVRYRFRARLGIWTSLSVAAESITREPELFELSAAQFFIDAQAELKMDDITLGNFLEEMNNTLSRDVFLLAKNEGVKARSLLEMSEEERQSHLAGHPKIILNKGRIGFDEEANNRYTPESASPFKLHWVAVAKAKTVHHFGPEVDMKTLLTHSMDETQFARFLSHIASMGLNFSDHFFIPVHPWQWQRYIKTQFAYEIHSGELMDLGEWGDLYLPQASLRTLTNYSRAGMLDIKLPLTILNTSAIRGLPAKYIKAGPELSEFVTDICQQDEILNDLGIEVLKERAGITLASSHFTQIKHAPYRYHEYLGATWRENATTKAKASNASAMMTGSLFYVDQSGGALLSEIIKASGLEASQWLQRYFRHVVIPLYHLQLKHGIGLVSHGQNIVLKLKDFIPCGVFIKDFGGDLRLSEAYSERYQDRPWFAVLTKLPPNYLIHDLYTGHFVTVLRYLSAILRDSLNFSETQFYALLALEVENYHQQTNYQGEINLLAPTFQRVLINAVRFKIGYGDASERPVPMLGSDLKNPLVLGRDQLQESHQL